MINEKSAGIVIFRNEKNQIKYLFLYKKSSGRYRESWNFPKGNIEENEKEQDAAIRETKEETGISEIKMIEGFKEKISYRYRKKGKMVFKEVVYFLGETNEKKIKVSHEHDSYEWLIFEDALIRASYPNSRKILKKVDEFLTKHSEQKTLFG